MRKKPLSVEGRQYLHVDVDHVDHAADEVYKQPQETVTNHVDADTQGFPNGPHDTSRYMLIM